MTTNDIRSIAVRLLDRIKRLPLLAIIGIAASIITVGIVVLASNSAPSYTPLFEGLTPEQGGIIIIALQKDGIPYTLNNGGNVISVPSNDVGKARLDLGSADTPGAGGSAALKSLEHASMTTSQVATRTLRDQALESSLRKSIKVFSGAQNVQVLLARPRSTPFLSDQPKAKASIVLTGASQSDSALGQSVAQIVSGAVPGLNLHDVVVATSHGRVLYPVSRAANASQQMGIQRRIEASQEAKIREILVPVLGSGNFRVSVSANVKFQTKTINSVAYGPKFFAVSSNIDTKKTLLPSKHATGIPGALSNQPPGASTAPLNQPKTTKKTKKKLVPENSSKKDQETYALDETDTLDHPAGWSIHNIAVSVVVNRSAIGKLNSTTIKKMVLATIAQSKSTVRVTSAAFVAPGRTILPPPRPNVALIIQAVFLLLSAIGLLFGVALPSVRWLRAQSAIYIEVASDPAMIIPLDSGDAEGATDGLNEVTAKVNDVGRRDPAALAHILEQWTRTL